MYLLDTNACIRVLNNTSQRLVTRLRAEDPSAIRLSSVTKAELLFGARNSSRVAANLRLLDRFFAPFVSLPFDDQCAEYYSVVRADLAARGQLTGPNDMLIAATARAHDLILVTHNTGEFSRVVALKVEDWES